MELTFKEQQRVMKLLEQNRGCEVQEFSPETMKTYDERYDTMREQSVWTLRLKLIQGKPFYPYGLLGAFVLCMVNPDDQTLILRAAAQDLRDALEVIDELVPPHPGDFFYSPIRTNN